MSQNPFQKASRSQVYLKLAVTGVSGSGKTLSALRLAWGMVKGTGKRIALIDTENDSASLYADMTEQQCKSFGLSEPIDFDVCGISPPFAAAEFNSLVQQAASGEYGVVVIDSASHLWKGILAYKGDIDARGGNQYTNWREPDKKFQDAIDAVLQSKISVIFCMRSKTEYILEDNGKGKQTPRKVGLAPIMRDGMEFEFSAVLDVQMDHKAQSSKDRTGLFPSDRIFQITEETGVEINNWLKTATPKAEPMHEPEKTVKEKWLAEFKRYFIQKALVVGMDVSDFIKCFTAIALNGAPGKLEDLEEEDLAAFWAKRKDISAEVAKVTK